MKRNFRLCLSAAILIMAALATASCTDAAAPLADEPADVPGTPAEDLTGKPIQIGSVISLPATNGADTEANGEADTRAGAKTRAVANDDGFPVEGSTMTVFCFVPDAYMTNVSPAAHANYTYDGSSWQPINPDAPLCWQNSTQRHFFAAVSPAVDDTEVDFGAKAKGLVNGTSSDEGGDYISEMIFDPAFSLPTIWTNERYTSWGSVRSTAIGDNCVYGEAPKANAQISLTLCRPLVSVNIISESTQVTLRNAPAATSSTASLSNPSTCAMQMLSSDGLIHRAYTLPYTNSSVKTTDISFITDAGASKSTVANKGLMAGGQVRIIKEGANMSIVTTTAGGLSTALNGAGTSKKKIVIGGTINDADMSALSTFCNKNKITDLVILADGVTSIGNSAFVTCYSLKSISLPDGVTSIGNYAFNECNNLASISLPDGLTSIGNKAFSYCYSLTSISLPDGLTSIGDEVFNNCTSLASISLPNELTSIGNNAFYYCISLASISLPDGLTSIGDGAFYDCTSLASINLPNELTSIGKYIFNGCSLTSISLPDGVTSIGDGVFNNCSNLEEISLSGINDQNQLALPTLGSSVFTNTKISILYLRDVPPDRFNAANYTTWDGTSIAWKAIHYGYNGPDDDLYHTDAAYYSGHWFAPTPQP